MEWIAHVALFKISDGILMTGLKVQRLAAGDGQNAKSNDEGAEADPKA